MIILFSSKQVDNIRIVEYSVSSRGLFDTELLKYRKP